MTFIALKAPAQSDIRREWLAKIKTLRASLCEPLASVEWRSLPIPMRTVIVLMAGMDDGHELKAWAELTPPEQLAIKSQIKSMKRSLAPLISLTGY